MAHAVKLGIRAGQMGAILSMLALSNYGLAASPVWDASKRIGGPGEDYVVGRGAQVVTLESTDGTMVSTSAVNSEIAWIAKYDTNGVIAWVNAGTGQGNGNATSIALDPATGGIYVVGRLAGTQSFTSSDKTVHTVPGGWGWSSFIVKYGPDGDYQWARGSWFSPNGGGNGVAADEQGNAYMVGWSEGDTSFDSGAGPVQSPGISGPAQMWPDYPSDGFLVRYTPSGDVAWVTKMGGYKAGYHGVIVTPDNQVHAVGFVGNPAGGNPSQIHTIATSTNCPPTDLGMGTLTAPFNMDGVWVTYDASGCVIQAKRYGGAENEMINGIARDAAGKIALSGYFTDTIVLDGLLLNGAAPLNALIAQYSAGQIQWALAANGAAYPYWGMVHVAPDLCTGWLVSGIINGAATFGSATWISAGQYDGYFARIDTGEICGGAGGGGDAGVGGQGGMGGSGEDNPQDKDDPVSVPGCSCQVPSAYGGHAFAAMLGCMAILIRRGTRRHRSPTSRSSQAT